MSHGGAYPVFGAVLMILTGVWMLFFQEHYSAWQQRRYQARLADREARGKDSYFEELRELKAYPPQRFSVADRKIGGALIIILGASFLALELTR